MNIAVTGSSGFIGRALVPFLTASGHRVTRLARTKPSSERHWAFWGPHAGTGDAASLEGLDAVVHLAGENIASRWTARKKARILDSRVKGTRLLSETLTRLAKPPGVLVCASAIGYYGDRGEEVLKEDSPPGWLFLSEVCRQWEAASEPAARSGIRVVNTRFGMVLGSSGGALAPLLLAFRMGLGGRIGSGRQYMSWIAMDDLLGAVLHALTTDALHGPVNVVAPNPVTNAEFTKTLGRVLKRPTLFPLPAFAARLALGGMADDLLLASARVAPACLLASGYRFRFPDLEAALRHVLGKSSTE